MTLADIKNSVYRRTQTNSTSFPNADMVIALNAANERVHSLIRKWIDNFRPTAWTTSDLTTGTAEPKFDALFHDLVPLIASYDRAVERNLPSAAGFLADIQRKEAELNEWYGMRNYEVFTMTIAAPAVFTKQAHGLSTNDEMTLVTTGALPTGFSVDTYYFAVYVTDNTFQLSATRDGSAITSTGSQSGTHYFATKKEKRMVAGRSSNK